MKRNQSICQLDRGATKVFSGLTADESESGLETARGEVLPGETPLSYSTKIDRTIGC